MKRSLSTTCSLWPAAGAWVELLEDGSADEHLRDVLGEGDLLGLERFVDDGSYLYTARTASDVILYGLAAELFESLAPQYPFLKRFLAAHFPASGILGFGRTSWLDADLSPPEFLRARLIAMPIDSTVKDATLRLAEADHGVVVLLHENGTAGGVLTRLELCGVADGAAASHAGAMPPTTQFPLTVRKAVQEMLAGGSDKLAITSDGTIGAAWKRSSGHRILRFSVAVI